jgi:excisionase family DNA binding protein
MSAVPPERVLVPLPDGRWLALPPDVFREALTAGSALATPLPCADQPATSEQLIDAEQLAKALSLPVSWIEQAARERRIPSIQAGRWRRFSRSAVERALLVNGK